MRIMRSLRSGVTPVIATVLLTMMAVALAGAAAVWFSDLQGGIIGGIEADLNTEISVKDLQCNAGSNPNITIALKNSGRTDIAADRVDLFADDSSGDLNITVTNMDLSGKAFTAAGGFDTVTVLVNGANSQRSTFLEVGEFYDVELDFTTSGTTVAAGTCVAE